DAVLPGRIAMIAKRSCDRRGNVAVIVAVLLIPLMGVLAICIDGGLMMFNRRHLQSAADASALAAVTDLFTIWNTDYRYEPAGYAVQSAKTTATANGFDGTTGNTVTVNIQKLDGSV